jgi:hypothetical protein
MTYDSFQFYYPPRIENSLPSKYLEDYDNGEYLAQPKLNGDSALIFTNGKEIIIRKRDKNEFKKNVDNLKEIGKELHKKFRKSKKDDSWIVVVGEWMTKSKKNKNGENFNGNFVIFDILVYQGEYLLSYTFEDRYKLLVGILGAKEDYDSFILKTSIPHLFLVKSFYEDFELEYNLVISVDMYEGLVLKKCKAKLEIGLTEINNHRSQVKFRKETKNYAY